MRFVVGQLKTIAHEALESIASSILLGKTDAALDEGPSSAKRSSRPASRTKR
jgi:hypothetical protein